MALIAVPGLIALVSHSSGGVILSTAANGYLAGSLIPASVVAFAPVALGAVLVVGAGAYFYLHGIPVPIAEILASKGLGASVAATATEVPFHVASAVAKGSATAATVFAVSAVQIVVVLAALAAVSYFAYTHSDAVKNAIDTVTEKAKASTTEIVAEIMDTLERAAIAASECTTIAVEGAKAKVKDVAHEVEQATDKAKEGVAATANQLKAAFVQATDKASTLETVAEIMDALERAAIAASECTTIAVEGAKAKVKDVAHAVDQVADKAKEGVATTATQLKATLDQTANTMDSAWHVVKKHLVPDRLKS